MRLRGLPVRLFVGTILLATVASPSFAQPEAGSSNVAVPTEATEEEAGEPETVVVGVYVNHVPAVRLKDNQFVVDFWIWFRWTAADLDPVATFELANGNIESRSEVTRLDLPDGAKYATARINATVTKFWDISRFPLDSHELQIVIEDSANEEFLVKYVADAENSKVGPEVQVPGWTPEEGRAEVVTQVYHSNYGDVTLPSQRESSYSRFVYTVPIRRHGIGYFSKLFFPLFIAVAIALTAFFIKPTDLDPRFGLGIGAIFAAVASNYVIASVLPDTNVITLADQLHLLAFLFVFLTIVESTFSLYLFTRGDGTSARQSVRLDRVAFVTLGAAYLAANVAVVAMR